MIAFIARQIYYNSWIPNDNTHDKQVFNDIPPNVGNNNILYYFGACLASINYILIAFLVFLVDSMPSQNNKIKRIGFIFQIGIYTWVWFQMYFNLN